MPDPKDISPVHVEKKGDKFVVVGKNGEGVVDAEFADGAAAAEAAQTINDSWERAKAERKAKGAPAITEGLAQALQEWRSLDTPAGLMARRPRWDEPRGKPNMPFDETKHPRLKGKFVLKGRSSLDDPHLVATASDEEIRAAAARYPSHEGVQREYRRRGLRVYE